MLNALLTSLLTPTLTKSFDFPKRSNKNINYAFVDRPASLTCARFTEKQVMTHALTFLFSYSATIDITFTALNVYEHR